MLWSSAFTVPLNFTLQKLMRRTNSKFPASCTIKTSDVNADKRRGLAIPFTLQAKLLMRRF